METRRDETQCALLMDGAEHEVPGRGKCWCDSGERVLGPRDCLKCGGYVHFQPVYGGYYFECEECGDQP